MIIIGAKGFAKEVLEVLKQRNELENLFFYDDVNEDIGNTLYGIFPILKSLEEAKKMIELSSIGEVVLDRKIESFFQVKETVSSNTVRLYFWEVTTNSGTAKGFSNSESQAKRMIELVSTGDILNYKIIQSADFEK